MLEQLSAEVAFVPYGNAEYDRFQLNIHFTAVRLWLKSLSSIAFKRTAV